MNWQELDSSSNGWEEAWPDINQSTEDDDDVSNTLVVMVGDSLQKLSNGYIKATHHRVVIYIYIYKPYFSCVCVC